MMNKIIEERKHRLTFSQKENVPQIQKDFRSQHSLCHYPKSEEEISIQRLKKEYFKLVRLLTLILCIYIIYRQFQ